MENNETSIEQMVCIAVEKLHATRNQIKDLKVTEAKIIDSLESIQREHPDAQLSLKWMVELAKIRLV